MDSAIDLSNDTVFSIDDHAIIHYRHLKQDDLAQQRLDPFNASANASFVQAWQQLSAESNQAIAQVSEINLQLASYLNILDIKINLVAEKLLIPADKQEQKPQLITLSQREIAFGSQQLIAVGETLSLKIILLPSYQVLNLLAQITAVDTKPDQQHQDSTAQKQQRYWLKAAFTNISAIQEQWIGKHIIHKQASEIRKTRQL